MKQYVKYAFGTLNNQTIDAYVLENELGYKIKVMPYGATLLAYETPDKDGNFANIVVSTPNFDEYVGNSPRWGATIGPVAGRIQNAQFTLNETTYTLEKNNGNHHLHGGSFGYEQVIFEVGDLSDNKITFTTMQKAFTQGYPGNIDLSVTYELTEDGALIIRYDAVSDEDTLFNPTNHSYFNLNGDISQPVDNHFVKLNTLGYTVLDDDNIPTGEIDSTEEFLKKLQDGSVLADVFADCHVQIQSRNGLDHAFVLGNSEWQGKIISEETGRLLRFKTDAPAVVIYTANGFDNKTLIDGKAPTIHNGIALETQVLPDAINQNNFGNIILQKQERFISQTIYYATTKNK